MEHILEFPAGLPRGLFEVLRDAVEREGLKGVQLIEIFPPRGTLRASGMARLKIATEVAGDLASVVALAVALFAGSQQPSPESCHVRITTPGNEVEMTVPCQSLGPQNFIEAAKTITQSGTPAKIAITQQPHKSVPKRMADEKP